MTEKPIVTPTPTTKLPRPESNRRMHITVAPLFPGDNPKAATNHSPKGKSGTYKIAFILARPGILDFHENLDFPGLMASGDSLLEFPSGTDFFKFDLMNQQGVTTGFLFLPNEKRRLARAEVFLKASSFEEAETGAHYVVLPYISWLSYRLDVALAINGYEVEETATGVKKWVFGAEGKPKQFTLNKIDEQISFTPELRPIFATYREGLNSTNPFYQCLCFYKVAEAVKALRGKRRDEAKAASKDIREPSERIPNTESALLISDELSSESFKPYLGKKFTLVLDNYRDLIRNALAHLDPSQEVLVADYYDDIVSCEKAVPVMKFIAHQMVRNELETQFGKAPSVGAR